MDKKKFSDTLIASMPYYRPAIETGFCKGKLKTDTTHSMCVALTNAYHNGDISFLDMKNALRVIFAHIHPAQSLTIYLLGTSKMHVHDITDQARMDFWKGFIVQ